MRWPEVTLLLTNEDVLASLDMRVLIDALEQALLDEHEGHLVQPPRQNLYLQSSFFRIGMACLPRADILGFKAFNGSRESGVRYVVNLYSGTSGALLAMLDASYLTAARTGAMSGVATRHLARAAGARVGVIGSGLEAWTNLSAVLAVRETTAVAVYSPNADRRAAFAQRVEREFGVPCSVAASGESAVKDADTVVVATNTGKGSGVCAFDASWLAPGMHVNSIGSTMPDLRELETAVFAKADCLTVDSREAVIDESGDVQEAMAEGQYPQRPLELAEVVAASSSSRASDAEVTVFKSVGTAMQDLVAAQVAYTHATEHGVGTLLPDFPEPKFV